ncbi:hypothetical protein QNH98_02470 [Myroides sp. mNGS23_01]|nr:hypothetical protein [Myroides sp. mNGS23_01]WHT39582.1 hypothetical protein QNH98_02470 [Myroides sp. mNGS23_01]
MKNFIMLFLLVFGVNTAVQAQTRAQFKDVRSGEVLEYQFERSISKDAVKAILEEGQRISPSSSNYGGSFTLYVGIYDRNRGCGIFMKENIIILDISLLEILFKIL